MIYTNCDCPVDPGDGIPYVIALTGKPPVLLYCPSCGCAWAGAKDVDGDQTRGLPDFGLNDAVIRYATEDEIRAAGHEITGTYAPWLELPQSDKQRDSAPRPQQVAEAPQQAESQLVRIVGEIDFHIIVLYVAMAIPVFGLPLAPWVRIGIGWLAPQGRILSHASDLRSRAEPSWAYLFVNEVLVVAVVGAYALLR